MILTLSLKLTHLIIFLRTIHYSNTTLIMRRMKYFLNFGGTELRLEKALTTMMQSVSIQSLLQPQSLAKSIADKTVESFVNTEKLVDNLSTEANRKLSW